MKLIIFIMLLPCLALAQDIVEPAGWMDAAKTMLDSYWPVLAMAVIDFLVEKSPLKSNSIFSAIMAVAYAPIKKYLESRKK